MSDAPVVAAAFGTVLEAQAFVNLLDAEEIRAHIIDGETGTTLGYLGAAVGGIKVVVLPRHLERASQVLGELRGAQAWGEAFSDDTEWVCAGCEAAVPAEHEVCWSCGAARTGEEAPAFEAVDPDHRTVGEAASAVHAPAERRAWAAEAGRSRTAHRSFWGFLLLFVFGPVALFALGVMLVMQPKPSGAWETQRQDLQVAVWGCVCLVLGAAVVWVLSQGLPF